MKEWLIKKGAFYYRPNFQGYTVEKSEAGRYTKEQAEFEANVEPWHMKAIHQDDVPDSKLQIYENALKVIAEDTWSIGGLFRPSLMACVAKEALERGKNNDQS